MSEPRNRLDDWLEEPVPLMLPPSGTFELIRKRARRRKLARAAATSALGIAVVAAAITVPQIFVPKPTPSTPVASATSPSSQPAASGSPAASSPPPAGGGQQPVLPHFAVSSVTFVSATQGWVIGQAGTSGHCTGPVATICTSLAGTDDGGRTWHGVPAPVTGGPDGAAGVSQVRFLDSDNGWAFGPQLWATHNGGAGDGGTGWTQIPTNGMRVTDVEAAAGRVFAIWASCGGTGRDFAGQCTSFSLYSSAAGQNQWAPVPGMTGLSAAGGTGSAALVLGTNKGYLLAPSGTLYSGPVTSTSGWGQVTSGGTPVTAPCAPGPAQSSGQPSRALLSGTGLGSGNLLLLCPGASTPNEMFFSSDGGVTWQSQGSVPLPGTATSLSGIPTPGTGGAVVGTTSGISVAASPAGPWHSAAGASARGGFSFVGMTEPDQGVAVGADQRLDSLWITYDAGLHWTRSRLPS